MMREKMNKEEFIAFLKEISREVQTWPEWIHTLVSHVPRKAKKNDSQLEDRERQ